MTPNRPYLVRALYEWILDNDVTPYLLVDASRPGTVVPSQFVEDGKILLNISPSAVQGLLLGNDRISFNARFGGVPMAVLVPAEAVIGIYARENGHGMLFPEEDVRPAADAATGDDEPEPTKSRRDRPTLKVVK